MLSFLVLRLILFLIIYFKYQYYHYLMDFYNFNFTQKIGQKYILMSSDELNSIN